MHHTNAQRGSDGRFGATDAPKARRIEVWLQPATVELLDVLCKQWGVGRGKVIDQLITRGPVAPAAWAATQAKPTPSAPPEPAPTPTTDLKAGDRVRFADGHDICAGAIGTVQAVNISRSVDGAPYISVTFCWINANGEEQQIQCLPDDLTPTPEPTPSGRGTVFDDPAYIAMQEKMSREWKIAKADAKVIGCDPRRVAQFKSRRKLDHERPLSVDAQQLLRDELENDERTAKGEAAALELRLERLASRADEAMLQQLSDSMLIPHLFLTVKLDKARLFLLKGFDAVGLKPRKKLVQSVWDDLHQLVPAAVPFDTPTQWADDPEERTAMRCLFWGTVIRLWSLEGEPPTTVDGFLEWSKYAVHQSFHERQANQRFNLGDAFAGRTSAESAAKTLGLPVGVELTTKAINDAYKSLAKQHHPDAGGDASKFQRITEARDRLLHTV